MELCNAISSIMLGKPTIMNFVSGNKLIPTSGPAMHSREERGISYSSDSSVSPPNIDIDSIKLLKSRNLEEADKKEMEKWAMLAGQASFRLESFIFNEVLPKEICRPHVFPRTINDMELHIERCIRLEENETTLNNARAKWKQLRLQLGWKNHHRNVLLIIKRIYLNVPNPLEIVRELETFDTRSYAQTRKAFRTVLPSTLWKEGDDIVNMMMKLHLLHDEIKPNDML
ncbi:uncharacterized protein LOC117108063 isoform X2 [Anneissia japonica]|uniref:uncharacterized protein LOC117108063 isoform X2 n=1 Tax=Anneissia japonica TaxID=1529436 RepID=UPI0014259EBF|nr:uncharacterized protein LOC117108063 isoform X2 [Anneissia japonica]